MKKNTSPDSFWHLSAAEAAGGLNCSSKGLSVSEAAQRIKTYGPNTIKSGARSSGLFLFLSQFKSPVTILLIVAALLSAGLGDVADRVIILVIVLISSLLGFWQEHGAANVVAEL